MVMVFLLHLCLAFVEAASLNGKCGFMEVTSSQYRQIILYFSLLCVCCFLLFADGLLSQFLSPSQSIYFTPEHISGCEFVCGCVHGCACVARALRDQSLRFSQSWTYRQRRVVWCGAWNQTASQFPAWVYISQVLGQLVACLKTVGFPERKWG